MFLHKTFKALNGLLCADVPLRNYYSLTHSLTPEKILVVPCVRNEMTSLACPISPVSNAYDRTGMAQLLRWLTLTVLGDSCQG